jgi:Restriction endonuclease
MSTQLYDYCLLIENYPTEINGVEIASEDRSWKKLARLFQKERAELKDCPYCKKQLRMVQREKKGSLYYKFEKFSAKLWLCANCGYWQTYFYFFEPGEQDGGNIFEVTKPNLQLFSEDFPEECRNDIAKAIRRNPSKWHDMEPTNFERFIGELFKVNFGDCEVFHVGRPADGGVDLYFIESGGKKWVIQVKRRVAPGYSEGVGVIRNLMGAMVDNDLLNGIFVSTCDHFTLAAKEYARRSHAKGYAINLLDRGKLNRMLDPLISPDDMKTYLKTSIAMDMIREKYCHDSFMEFQRFVNQHRKVCKGSELFDYR